MDTTLGGGGGVSTNSGNHIPLAVSGKFDPFIPIFSRVEEN